MSIAFIVYNKNEDEVVKFCVQNKKILENAKIHATRTEKNKIESALSKKITFAPSLDTKGDVTIAAKAARGEFSAIFYFFPSNEHSSGLHELLTACNKKKAYIALDPNTGDCIIQCLLDDKIILPSLLQRKESSIKNSVTRARSYTPGVLILEESDNLKAEVWFNKQLVFYLENNDLEYLKAVYFDMAPTEKQSKIFSNHETKQNLLQVKSGTVSELVDLLCLHEDDPLLPLFQHKTFVRNWFLTYSSFTTPKEFFASLKAEFHKAFEENDDSVAEKALAVLVVISLWVKMEYASDFANDDDLTKSLNRFFDKDVKEKISSKSSESKSMGKENRESISAKVHEIKTVLQKQLDLYSKRPEPDLKYAPQSIVPKRNKDATTLDYITDVDPLEIARQITLLEADIFRRIRSREFLKVAWTKKNKKELAPNLTKFLRLSSRISNWVVTEILKLKTSEEMSDIMIKFIKVGKHALSLKNYSLVMEIVTGMTNAAISRLPAWTSIPTKVKDNFDELSEFVSPLGHYYNYRLALANKTQESPILPLLGPVLSDLINTEEVFSNTTNSGAINWTKMSNISDKIYEVLTLDAYYEFKPVPLIQEYITNVFIWEDLVTVMAISELKTEDFSLKQGNRELNKKISKRKSTSMMMLDHESGDRDVLNETDWAYLLTGAEQPKTYKHGQVILAAGSVNDRLYRIRKGKVNVVKEMNGQEVVVASMHDNSMFGEISMLLRTQKGTATASIVADGEVEAWVLDIEFILNLLETRPPLAEKLNRILAINLAKRLRDLGKKPATQKSDSKKNIKETKDEKNEKSDKPKKDPNEKLFKKLGITNEVLIMAEECALKKNFNTQGVMILTQNNLCFYGKAFGSKVRHVLPLSSIMDIKKNMKLLDVTADVELSFTNFDDIDKSFKLLSSIWKHQQGSGSKVKKDKKRKSDRSQNKEDTKDTPKSSWLPSPEDWEILLKGARSVTYQKDDVIIKEGEQFRRIFQLIKGEVRFEKVIDGQNKVLGRMNMDGDGIFGEISFLEGGKASASVVADQFDTQTAIIEGYYLEIVFQYHPELSGRFYHYLANVLSKRLKQRETSMQSLPDNKKKKKKREKSES